MIREDPVKVTDPLPSGSTYLAGDTGCTFANGIVTCNYGTLVGNGSFATRHFSVIPTNPGMLTNTATASSSVADDNTADNADTVMTPVSMAVYDLAATSVGGGFACTTVGTKQTCDLVQTITLRNNSSTWLTGDLTLKSLCKKIGTTKVSCKLTGGFVVGTFTGTGVPTNQVTAYLSSDPLVDAADTSIASASSTALGLLAPKHKKAKIKYKHPKGQIYTGQHVLLKLDSLDAVGETDETNNVLEIGSFP